MLSCGVSPVFCTRKAGAADTTAPLVAVGKPPGSVGGVGIVIPPGAPGSVITIPPPGAPPPAPPAPPSPPGPVGVVCSNCAVTLMRPRPSLRTLTDEVALLLKTPH